MKPHAAKGARTMGGVGVVALSLTPPSYTLFMNSKPITMIAATKLPARAARVFDFHLDARNLPRLTPGRARILSAPKPTHESDLQVIEIGVRPLAMRWHARIVSVEPPCRLVDVQERGPFRYWRHTHAIVPVGAASVLVDVVEFRLISGWIGRMVDATVVAAGLRLMFAFRHRRTRRLLASRRGSQ